MTLTLAPAPWSLGMAALLSAAMRCDPGASVATLRALVESGRGTLLQILTDAGELVGAIVLRIDQRELGADGVIVAAATSQRWVWRYMPALLRDLEGRFMGVQRVRIHTGSRGLVRALARQGYRLRECVLDKEIAP